MDIFVIILLSFILFILGIICGFWVYNFLNPCVGALDVDDESNPDKVKWIFRLNSKISPEKISKKTYVRFMVYHNGR